MFYSNKKGMTLIELLAVIAIIAILFILLIPNISNAFEKARLTGVKSNFNDYRSASQSYLMSSQGETLSEGDFNRFLDSNLQFSGGSSKIKNPWGSPYTFKINNDNSGFSIITQNNDSVPKVYALSFAFDASGELSSTLHGFEKPLVAADLDDILANTTSPDVGDSGSETTPPASYCDSASPEADFKTSAVTGGVNITSYTGTSKEVSIPCTIGGLPVVSIGSDIFASKGLTSVRIPSSITKMGDNPFFGNPELSFYFETGNTAFKTDEKNSGIYSLDGSTIFSGTQKTFSTNTYSSIDTISNYAFHQNSITTATIPDGVVSIGAYAFSKNALTDIVLPNSLVGMGTYAFHQNSLTSITIPSSLTEIPSDSFSNNKLTSLTLHDSLTRISSNAFSDNLLTSVSIPDSVYIIENSAFKTNEISTLKLPYNLSVIESSTFAENNLTTVDLPGGLSQIKYGAFTKNKLTKVEIPVGVYEIGELAFSENELTEVYLPDTITRIEFGTFDKNHLSSFVIPDSVEFIGDYAFSNNYLSELTIGTGVYEIGSSAFEYNFDLYDVYNYSIIPNDELAYYFSSSPQIHN